MNYYFKFTFLLLVIPIIINNVQVVSASSTISSSINNIKNGKISLLQSSKDDNATISISFNETLKGFSTSGGSINDTIKDFEYAYIVGKEKGEIMSFALNVDITSVKSWLADPLHNAVCKGIVNTAIDPNSKNIPVGPAPGSLHIFDGGIHKKTHELMMEYSLPFTLDNKNYTLYGVKHIPGNNCLGLLTQVTTLYVHVFDADNTVDRTGIVKIGAGDIISLVSSIRIHGGTLADQIRGFLEFGLLLVGDIIENCISRSAFSTEFWYFWSSDADDGGVLLDLIKRPDKLELRLAQFIGGENATKEISVTREFLPLDDFTLAKDNVTVHFGKKITMGPNGVVGEVNGIPINVSFVLNFGHYKNSFLPPELALLGLESILPDPVSTYGKSGWPSGGNVGKFELPPSVPLVKTTYKIPYGVHLLNWIMISASQFIEVESGVASDLQIELVAMPLKILDADLAWISPTYIRIDDNEHRVNTIEGSTEFVKIISNGKLTPDNTQRIFAAEIQLPAAISGLTHVGVNCSAPANQFAFLDQEGKTYVHTTLYGTCKAMVTKMDEKGEMSTTTYKSKGQNLLEIKA